MEIKELIEEALAKQKEIVDKANAIIEQINVLTDQRQQLLQEALRYDGEIRGLRKVVGENGQKET